MLIKSQLIKILRIKRKLQGRLIRKINQISLWRKANMSSDLIILSH